MPSPRARLAVAAVNGLVYAIGGDTGGQVSGAVEVYDPAQNLWQVRAFKPTPVSNVNAAMVNGLLYVPGGTVAGGQPTAAMEAYDPVEDKWAARSPLPVPLCAYAMATLDDRIYVFGGWDGMKYSRAVYIYEPDRDSWHEGSPLGTARGFAGAGVVGQKIYVVGGFDERQEYGLCEEYDPALEGSGQSPWRERAPMSIGRGGLAVAVVGDILFAVGGGWQNYMAYNERYDPRSNTWTSFETPIVGQWRNLGIAVVDVNLYTIGGWSGDYLSTNEEYQALYRFTVPLRLR
jgi:N-acetylneuraminic acid mutarotase